MFRPSNPICAFEPLEESGVDVQVSVPIRICDIGGWTDTWFGGPGRVVNLAVRPGITVSLHPGAGAATTPVVRAALEMLPPPTPVVVEITSSVPPGCGAGTSAAAAVATLGALSLLRKEDRTPTELALCAHSLEVDVLGNESGIQDQLSAALGGINFIEIDAYPDATVARLPAWPALDERITLLYLGTAHDSSAVHRQVIEHATPQRTEALQRLRDAALTARAAVLAHDLHAFGEEMIANTDAQRALHPALVGADATRAIECARECGALGWKVNGAGGEGGSLTMLSADGNAKVALDRRLAALDSRFRVLPARVSEQGIVHGDSV
jgi:D-glycero-alpha-D-manno-heptose-7-phosphate kinase